MRSPGSGFDATINRGQPASASTWDFETVDLRKLKQQDAGRFDRLFAEFECLYSDAFPVLGGICGEHYRESRCGLLTYIAVNEYARGNRIARKLMDAMMARLTDAGKRCGQPLRAIFAEAEIPTELEPQLRPSSRERLAILGRLGARYVDVPYVQPALSGGGGRARHLMLLLFGGAERDMEGGVVREFMHEFYRALGVAAAEDDADFNAMFSQVHTRIPTAALESPALTAVDVAFCLHYVEPTRTCPSISRKTAQFSTR